MRSLLGAGALICSILVAQAGAGGALPARLSSHSVPLPTQSASTQFTGVSCVYTDLCFASGTTEKPSGPSATKALLDELYHAGSWTQPNYYPFPTGSTGTAAFGISCIETGSSMFFCMEVGEALYANGTTKEYVLQFSGTDHHGAPATVVGPIRSVLYAPQPSNWNPVLDSVSCRYANYCVAVGADYAHPAPNTSPKLAIATVFNGTTWSPMNPPAVAVTGANGAALFGVSCVTTPGVSGCLAVGSSFAGNQTREALTYLLGSSWHVIANAPLHASPDGGAYLAVSCAPTSPHIYCVLVGKYNRTGYGDYGMGATWSLGQTLLTNMSVPPYSLTHLYYGVDCTPAGACMAVGQDQSPVTMTDIYPPSSQLDTCEGIGSIGDYGLATGGTNTLSNGLANLQNLPNTQADFQLSAVSLDWPGGIAVGFGRHLVPNQPATNARCTGSVTPDATVP